MSLLLSLLSEPVGQLERGHRNTIADVPGVRVGHCTLNQGDIQTGVSVILPHSGDVFLNKVPAAHTVINGFGKSIGLIQLEELGVLETPIGLTNTFSVHQVAQTQIQQCIDSHPDIGRAWSTVNPLVLECNDGYLNDIQAFAITNEHYLHALSRASDEFEQGAVGAGRGMSSFGVKGGIGSASRLIPETPYTLGAFVLSNFGKPEQLTLHGHYLGASLKDYLNTHHGPEKGSIIIIIATDAPLDTRQLKRLSMRAASGLAKTGSVYGHGSGDIALAFSTAYTLPHHPTAPMPVIQVMHEAHLDGLFQAVSDTVQEAIYQALSHAETVKGRNSHQRESLSSVLSKLRT